jgi:GNAT superfamily N-acetyltransferase
VLIRPRREQDVPRCVTLLRVVHEHDGYPSVWPSDPGRWLTSAGTDLAAWVAVDDDGTIHGHVAAQAGRDDPELAALAACPADRLMLVLRLFVDRGGRERGTGAALLTAAAGYARQSGWQPALEVADTGIAARRLYGRLGWACVGTRRAGWHDPEGRHPLLYLYAPPPAGAARPAGAPLPACVPPPACPARPAPLSTRQPAHPSHPSR